MPQHCAARRRTPPPPAAAQPQGATPGAAGSPRAALAKRSSESESSVAARPTKQALASAGTRRALRTPPAEPPRAPRPPTPGARTPPLTARAKNEVAKGRGDQMSEEQSLLACFVRWLRLCTRLRHRRCRLHGLQLRLQRPQLRLAPRHCASAAAVSIALCSRSRRNHAKQRDPRAPAYATSLSAERSATSRACAASVAAAGPAPTRVEAAPPQAPRPGDANRPAPGEAARACALVSPPPRVYGLWRRTREGSARSAQGVVANKLAAVLA